MIERSLSILRAEAREQELFDWALRQVKANSGNKPRYPNQSDPDLHTLYSAALEDVREAINQFKLASELAARIAAHDPVIRQLESQIYGQAVPYTEAQPRIIDGNVIDLNVDVAGTDGPIKTK